MKSGQSIIELLVAFGLAAILLPALLTGLVASREGKAQQMQRVQAATLLRESTEVVRSVREKGWSTFAVNGTFYPAIAGSGWSLLSGTETVGDFTRQIVVSDVRRNATGAIVDSGGTVDPSSKMVVTTVSWSLPTANSAVLTNYITRYLDNDAIVETTKTDFDRGTTAGTKTQLTPGSSLPDDGEIVLSQTGGYGDWCTPTLNISGLDLPKSGVANAVSAIQGQAAAGTGENASGVSYANILITDPAYPASPSASIDGTFDGYKTNAVFTEENFAYLGTDNNAKEVVIINLDQKDQKGKYAEAGYFNAPGNGDGDSVATSGSVGYMASGNKFYTFDLSSKSGSRPRLNTSADLTLSGTGVKIVIVGANAYVATSATTNQLQIINVTDPASPQITASVSLPGQAGKDVFVNQTQLRAYVATAKSDSQKEFFVVNVNSQDAGYKQVLGRFDTGEMNPKGVVAVSGARAIIVGTGGSEYQVIDISNDTLDPLPSCGSLEVNSGINGVATVFTAAQRAYSYIITGEANTEFRIIEGGPGSGGGNYAPSGTFTSASWGPPVTLQAASFNRFVATIDQPQANNVQIQVAVADAVSGSCAGATYTFIGTDASGTGTGNYFATTTTGVASVSGAIPFGAFSPSYQNPGKCFAYQVLLTTADQTLTPKFLDMTVNFSQ